MTEFRAIKHARWVLGSPGHSGCMLARSSIQVQVMARLLSKGHPEGHARQHSWHKFHASCSMSYEASNIDEPITLQVEVVWHLIASRASDDYVVFGC